MGEPENVRHHGSVPGAEPGERPRRRAAPAVYCSAVPRHRALMPDSDVWVGAAHEPRADERGLRVAYLYLLDYLLFCAKFAVLRYKYITYVILFCSSVHSELCDLYDPCHGPVCNARSVFIRVIFPPSALLSVSCLALGVSAECRLSPAHAPPPPSPAWRPAPGPAGPRVALQYIIRSHRNRPAGGSQSISKCAREIGPQSVDF